MEANLHLVLIAVVSLFGVFMAGLGYGQWATRNVVLTPDRAPQA